MKKRYSYGSLFICFFFSICFFQCKKHTLIFSNPIYTVGHINYYTPTYTTRSIIAFNIFVNGQSVESRYSDGANGWSVPTSGNYNSGDKYMVEYNAGSPDNARFLFDYPVTSAVDSANYVNQFKTHPPSCCLIFVLRKYTQLKIK